MGSSPESGAGLRAWRAVFLAVMLGTLVAALLPSTGVPHAFPWQDKLMHAVAFAMLAILGWRARLVRPLPLFACLVAFGLAIEVAQSFTATRQAELLDLVADAVGAGLALMAVHLRPSER